MKPPIIGKDMLMKASNNNFFSVFFFAVLFFTSVYTGATQYKNFKNSGYQFKPQSIVYHLSDLSKTHDTLLSIENQLNSMGKQKVNITLVTNGGGAFSLVKGIKDKKGRSFETAIQTLSIRGVTFEICANTIRSKKINKLTLNQNAKIISSGISRIIDLQQKGFRYVKL